jgi:hypothetical protein
MLNTKARNTDPTTSHEAAKTVNENNRVYAVIKTLLIEPATDEMLARAYNLLAAFGEAPKQSPSGLRTRRNELYRAGQVEPIGYGKSNSNRRAIIWQTVKEDN